ncbi:MAG TPA: enoyl-CoA hydratase/isomerase family protein, partial [Jatrophihabitantaceae bacterium]|nr:enoyl-CoA hydratase/isomerase family protein [Jatrophihabitantaceae bacterium]
ETVPAYRMANLGRHRELLPPRQSGSPHTRDVSVGDAFDAILWCVPEAVLFETDGAVAWVTLNRPERHNAFDTALAESLRGVWRDLRVNDEVRAVVITGAGDKAFCTGIDRDWNVPQPSSPFMIDDPGLLLGPKTADLWKPVIAAVNGMACGGAAYILGEVESIVAADHATFFDPHTTYGMAAAFEPILLYGQMPFGELCRLALMGNHERMSAARAHEIGFVQDVVPLAALRETAGRVAHAIASQPAAAVEGTLRSLWAAREMARAQALAMAPHLVTLGNRPEAMAEGQATFASGTRIEPHIR